MSVGVMVSHDLVISFQAWHSPFSSQLHARNEMKQGSLSLHQDAIGRTLQAPNTLNVNRWLFRLRVEGSPAHRDAAFAKPAAVNIRPVLAKHSPKLRICGSHRNDFAFVSEER